MIGHALHRVIGQGAPLDQEWNIGSFTGARPGAPEFDFGMPNST